MNFRVRNGKRYRFKYAIIALGPFVRDFALEGRGNGWGILENPVVRDFENDYFFRIYRFLFLLSIKYLYPLTPPFLID